jgi:hypothetical protein
MGGRLVGHVTNLLLTACLAGLCLPVPAEAVAAPVRVPAGIPAPVPLPRLRPALPAVPAAPGTFAEAVAGLDLDAASVTSTPPSVCLDRLAAMALVEPLPRLIGPGVCGGADMVRMQALFLADGSRVAINPPLQLRCRMAEGFADFVRDDLVRIFRGRALRSIDGTGSYECRGRNRAGGKVSEHGKGNAVDVHSVRFADGGSLVPTDLLADKGLREALKAAACARFTTVLGPGSDGYHEEHVHLDLAERRNDYRICQWAVRIAGPPGAEVSIVPLPRPRPAERGGGRDARESAGAGRP